MIYRDFVPPGLALAPLRATASHKEAFYMLAYGAAFRRVYDVLICPKFHARSRRRRRRR